jgi:tetratricopeptide (TPR) repeat protein
MVMDFNERVARARAAGNSAQALPMWRELLAVTSVEEEDYRRCCASLCELYAAPNRRRPRSAAAIKEYLRDMPGAAALYAHLGDLRDQGRVLALQGDHLAASRAYESARMVAHAARSAEAARAHDRARELWRQLIRPADAQGDLYGGALARFNCGRGAKHLGHQDEASALFAQAMDLLGQEADRREADRDRDGAITCFLIMAHVGRAAGAFEDVAEGYLNCVRLFKQKGDRFETIRLLHEVIRAAEEQGELHAAAELYREAGEYARRMGFAHADHFLVSAGRAWKRVAVEGARLGRQQSLVESALLAAVDSFGRALCLPEVATCYEALAALDLGPSRRERYQRLTADLKAAASPEDAARNASRGLPEIFRRPFHHQEPWVRDLTDREGASDLRQVAARLLADQGVWDVDRRRALNVVLELDDHATTAGADAPLPRALWAMLGDCRHPSLVGPLLDLFRHGSVDTMRAAVTTAGRMGTKEAFALIDAALGQDRQSSVYDAGLAALRSMTSLHALDPLIRIFGNHDDPQVRELALRNAAMIGNSEAAEFLLDVVRSNVSGLGDRAREELLAHASYKMLSVLEVNLSQEPDPVMRSFLTLLVEKVRARQPAR